MSDEKLLAATIQAVIATSKRLCERRDCGIPERDQIPGSRHRDLRCEGCPLDDVDGLADALT